MIRSILAGLFILFLPGISLINAVFPGKGELDEELDLIYRIVYGIGASAAMVIILGFILGSLPYGNDGGYFTAEYIWTVLVVITITFLVVGWYRGAYQWLRYVHPSLSRPKPSFKKEEEGYEREMEDVKELQSLKRKQMSLKEDLKEKRGKSAAEKKRCRDELERVEKELKELEKKIEKRF